MNQESNELIERYVHQVAERLPAGRREDVTRELESLIRDRVEDEAAPGEAPETVTVQVLKGMGDPALLATRYGYEPNLLVSTRSLPAFFRLVKIVPLAVAVLFAAQFAVSVLTGARWQDALGAALLGYVNSTLLNLGILVMIFIALERLPAARRRSAAAFDPRKLPRVPASAEGGKVRTGRMVAQIYVAAAAFILANFRPDWFGPMLSLGGPHRFEIIPLSALGIHVPLVLLDVWLITTIVLKTEVLRHGAWTRTTRWVQVGQACLGLAVFVSTLLASQFGQLDMAYLGSVGISDSLSVPLLLSRKGLAIALVCLALLALIRIGTELRRLSRPRPAH